MRLTMLFVLLVFPLIFPPPIDAQDMILPPWCDLIPDAEYLASDYTPDGPDAICFAENVQTACPADTICDVMLAPTWSIFNTGGLFFLTEEASLPPDLCVTNGWGEEVARNRLGDRSVTCGYEGLGFSSYTGWMIVIKDDMAFSVAARSDTIPQPDPLPLAQYLVGQIMGESVFASSGSTLSTISSLPSPLEDGIPEPPESVDGLPALAACDGLDDTAEANCLAQLVTATQDPTYCYAAVDVYACGQALMRQLGDSCETQTDVSISACYNLLASESGIEAACERLPANEQASCFVLAGSASGDYSIIERRFGDDPEAQDFVRTVFAVNRYDPELLEAIQDNERYDLAKVYMIVPMGINGGVVYDRTYCDELRGNYDSEYPEDAVANYEFCVGAVDLIRRFNDLETDAERDAFQTELEEAIARMEAEFDGELDE